MLNIWLDKLSESKKNKLINQELAWLDALVNTNNGLVLNQCESYLERPLSNQFDFETSLQLVLAIDEKNQQRVEQMTQQFLAVPRSNKQIQEPIFSAVQKYQRTLFAKYTKFIQQIADRGIHSLNVDMLVLLFSRQLNAGFQASKWRYFEDQPAAPNSWSNIYASFKVLEKLGLHLQKLDLYENSLKPTSVSLLLKQGALMDSLISGNFTQQEIELTSSLLQGLLRDEVLEPQSETMKLAFAIDLNSDKGLEKTQGAKAQSSYRYWQMTELLIFLERMLNNIEANSFERDNLVTQFALEHIPALQYTNTDRLAPLLKKLVQHWKETKTAYQRRKERRFQVMQEASVVYGFENITRQKNKFIANHERTSTVNQIDAPRFSGLANQPKTSDNEVASESWKLIEISKNGFAATLNSLSAKTEIGALIGLGLSEDGSRYFIGSIRSIKRSAKGKYRVGVELLGTQQEVVAMTSQPQIQKKEIINGFEADFTDMPNKWSHSFAGILLSDEQSAENRSLILPRTNFTENADYLMARHGTQQKMQFKNVVMHNDWVSMSL